MTGTLGERLAFKASLNCERFPPEHIYSHPEVFPSAFVLLIQARENMLIDSDLVCVNMTFSANADGVFNEVGRSWINN